MATRLTLLEEIRLLMVKVPAGRVVRCLRTLDPAGVRVTAQGMRHKVHGMELVE